MRDERQALTAPPRSPRSLAGSDEQSACRAIVGRAMRMATVSFDRAEIPHADAPNEAERAILRRRLQPLTERLAEPCSQSAIAAVMALRQVLPFQGKGDAATEQAAGAMYGQALRDLPGWAVLRAVEAINRGEAGLTHRFMPTPPELRAIVWKQTQPLRDERAAIERVLSATIAPPGPSDDERARRLEQLEKLTAKLAAADSRVTRAAPADEPLKPLEPGDLVPGAALKAFIEREST